MAFDETPVYVGPITALNEGTPNMLNSFYVQRAVFASLPAAGNDGVTFLASDGAAGGGGDEALYRDNGSTWDLIGLIPATVAPTAATYLVGAAHADLSAEIVVGPTPGGELGNTWASPTVDGTHSGSAHHAVLAEASQAELEAESAVAKYVPPDLVRKSPAALKARVNIATLGTVVGTAYNVSSVTDSGVGLRVIVWDTDFSGIDNQSVVSSGREHVTREINYLHDQMAVGSCDLTVLNDAGTLVDVGSSTFAGGDQ